MRTRATTGHGCIIFVDVSGSMESKDEITRDKVTDIINTTSANDGVVSLYSSNHNLCQHFFNNKKTFCKNFEYGGLSSVYDNFLRCIHEHLDYDPDMKYDVYVFSDLMDNNSKKTKGEFCSFVDEVDEYWKIHFITHL